jgi:WD40 repeat protein
LRLWDVESGQPIGDALEGHTHWVNHAAFSPDGKKLASASEDYTLRLWDVESGQPIGDALEGHTHWVHHIVFSPDGKKLASASGDNTLRLWDVESGQPIGDALKDHTDWINHVVFSPDGKKLASASRDNTFRPWDVESGQPTGDSFKGDTEDSEDQSLLSQPMLPSFMHFDEKGFLCHTATRLLWLPLAFHGLIAVHASSIAIGGHNGAVTFVQLCESG